MTLGTQVSLTERLARTSPNAQTLSSTSDVTRMYINEGCREFAKRVHGVATESLLTLTPRFNIPTNYAVKFAVSGGVNEVASTNVYLTPTAHTAASGSGVASYLQAMLNTAVVAGGGSGSLTLQWSASSWQFYVNAGTATTVYFGSPSDDARAIDGSLYVGLSGTAATSTFTGDVPLDCTLESTLPAGFLEIQYVEWDDAPLTRAPYSNFLSPQSQGTPQYYAIQNKKIRVNPTPTQQEKFLVRYKGMPDDFDTDGTDDASECTLPTEVHMAPVYYAAAMILEEMHQHEEAAYLQSKFESMAREYRMREANNNPTLFPGGDVVEKWDVQLDTTADY